MLAATSTSRGLGPSRGSAVRPPARAALPESPGTSGRGCAAAAAVVAPAAGSRAGVVFRQLKHIKEAVWEQMDEDTDLEGLTLTERLARGAAMGRLPERGRSGPSRSACESARPARRSRSRRPRRARGEKAGDQILRAVDARRQRGQDRRPTGLGAGHPSRCRGSPC